MDSGIGAVGLVWVPVVLDFLIICFPAPNSDESFHFSPIIDEY